MSALNMGVYLSTPNTDKDSTDQECSNFTYGASSMQGWRMSQEDAHNCIPNFDGNSTSFFAVYDGHGGAEVAQYCAEHFPGYLKTLDKFKNKEIGPALEEAFLGFDSHLLTDEVQKALKVSAGLDDVLDDDEEKARQKNEAEMLRQEADMPIEELMAQYEGAGTPAEIKNLRKKKQINSPMIRAKRPMFGQGDEEEESDIKDNVPLDGSVIPLRATADIQEKLANGHAENENNLNREKEQSDILQKAQGGISASSGSNVRKMECDSVVKTDEESVEIPAQQAESSEACSSSVLSSSSSSSSGGQSVQNASVSSTDNNQEAVSSKREVEESAEADSTSQETGVAKVGGSSSQNSEVDEKPSSTHASDGSVDGSAGSTQVSNGGGSASSAQNNAGGSSSSSSSSGGGKKQGKSKHLEDIESEEEELDEEDSEDEDVEFNSSDEEDDESDDSEESDEEEDEDDDMLYPVGNEQNNDEPGFCSGCTAVVAVIHDKEVVVANAGDSRCILCRDGKALDLSFDHKPEDDIERNRIVAAGGKVTSDGRVNGGLNLSRAIGDHFYKRNKEKDAKEQMITALPDLQTATLQETDQFMVLACDGIWNYMTSQEVVDFVSERLKDPEKKKKPSIICGEIFDYCLAPNTLGDGTGCDNMTCIIVTFDQMWNNNQNKRAADQLDGQPEKRAKVEQT